MLARDAGKILLKRGSLVQDARPACEVTWQFVESLVATSTVWSMPMETVLLGYLAFCLSAPVIAMFLAELM